MDTANGSSTVNPVVVVAATMTLVLMGLSLLILTAILPSLLLLTMLSTLSHHTSTNNNSGNDSEEDLLRAPLISAMVLVQLLHLQQLWTNPNHLAFYRWLSRPIRRSLFPVVMLLCRLDSIRDGEPTMYLPTDDLQNLDALEGKEKTALLLTFRQSVRRRHRQMEQLFVAHGLHRSSVYAESMLNLSQILPIIWNHIQAQCKESGKGFVGEFVKRLLVMTMVPDAILDIYYKRQQHEDEPSLEEPVAVQLSVLQGNVLHWFMYFSTEHRTGIWFQGILLSMTRGVQMGQDVKYINAQTHHESSKRNAGFLVAEPSEHALLLQLYPWDYTRTVPTRVVQNAAWEDQEH